MSLSLEVPQTLFYEVDKIGNGWTVKKCERVAEKWIHYNGRDNSIVEELPLQKPYALADLKKHLNRRYCATPFTTAVFECNIVAPSQIVLIVWVGMSKVKSLPERTLTGTYIAGCQWPDQITKEQYRQSQQF